MKKLILLILFSMLASCATKQNYIILNFSDFGPLTLSRDLLGNDWWQWQSHGNSKPRVYNIKVVVYKDISSGKIKQLFPVIIEKKTRLSISEL